MKLQIPGFVLLAMFSACSYQNRVEPFLDSTVGGPFVEIVGEVRFLTIEGGFWAIKGAETMDQIEAGRRISGQVRFALQVRMAYRSRCFRS
jgi:hypothetical protein